MIDELWLQTLIAVLSDKPFVHAYLHNLKTTGYIWTFSILNDCSTIGHIPCVDRVAREIQLECYGSRHASVVL